MQFPNMFYVDVDKGPVTQPLHPLFLGDALANRIGVYLYKDGEPFSPGGSAFGRAVLSGGETVLIQNGVVSGNQIYVDLPSGVYAEQGPVKISVSWTDGTTTTTVLEGTGNVRLTETGTIIDPGTIISDVTALINAINAAVASIPPDYTDLLETIAPDFSTSSTYNAGQYVWYDGTLYRFTAAHAAGSWIGTDAETISIDDALVELKAEQDATERTMIQTAGGAALKNLYDPNDPDVRLGGFYDGTTWRENASYSSSGYIPVVPGGKYRSNYWSIHSATSVNFYSASKAYISKALQVNGVTTVPNNAYYIRIPVLIERMATTALYQSDSLLPFVPAGETLAVAQKAIIDGHQTDQTRITFDEVVDAVKVTMTLQQYSTASGYLGGDGTIITNPSTGVIHKYTIPTGTKQLFLNGTSTLYSGTNFDLYWIMSGGQRIAHRYVLEDERTVFNDEPISIPDGAEEIWLNQLVPSVKRSKDIVGGQWFGKVWYAYGTSITDTTPTGKYPPYLAQMAGLTLVDKGVGGGGIGNLGAYSQGQVYSAICNTTDGKLNADLITLETGANDCNANVPLGTIYDTGTETLAGCLNDCLRYLQANTDAQIAVTCSPATTTAPNAANKYYEWAEMVERICRINRVHFLNPDNNMGYAKLASDRGSDYVVDNIHQTNLGGYIMAQNLWYQLRNIPPFYTAIPGA